MTNTVSFFTHEQIDAAILNVIVELKMQHWPHPAAAQKRWIDDNISNQDVHVCMFDQYNKLIAYLNLVDVHVTSCQEKWNMSGVGNVSVDKLHLGKGLGLEIMQSVNDYLHSNNRVGLLLCRKELEGFYTKAGWCLFNGSTWLQDKPFNNLVFSTVPLNIDQLNIERNF